MLRDAEEVMGRIQRVAGVEYTVLVPNLRGAERAMDVKPDEFNLVMSTSETHNLSNLRMPRENSFAALRDVIDRFGSQVPINVSLSACFGCPMEGDVPQAEVMHWSQRFADLGVRGLTIFETTGMAQPLQVAAMCEALRKAFPQLQLTLHFHNTRGMGLANVLCPYAPGASGNISSEDAIHMLDAMGYATGIDLERLLTIARELPAIVGHVVPGQVAKSGRITDLHPAPPVVAELKKAFS